LDSWTRCTCGHGAGMVDSQDHLRTGLDADFLYAARSDSARVRSRTWLLPHALANTSPLGIMCFSPSGWGEATSSKSRNLEPGILRFFHSSYPDRGGLRFGINHVVSTKMAPGAALASLGEKRSCMVLRVECMLRALQPDDRG
jgi:hypothetical protein